MVDLSEGPGVMPGVMVIGLLGLASCRTNIPLLPMPPDLGDPSEQ